MIKTWSGVANDEVADVKVAARVDADIPEDVERRLVEQFPELGRHVKRAWRAGLVDIQVSGDGKLMIRRH
jgi:hypothetical protein